jgi:pimeloyl-ACP methyl ester carboxylesterase
VLLLLSTLAAVLCGGYAYQRRGAARDRERLAGRGERALVHLSAAVPLRRRMHCYRTGQGSPAVILESGIAASSLSWAPVQQQVEQLTTVLSYDRAGFGWSDPAAGARTPQRLAEELRALLTVCAIKPPYLLVGHSFGGLIIRAYAQLYPNEVAGLVLVDALSPREWAAPGRSKRRMIRGGILFSLAGAALASVGVVRLCLTLVSRGRRTGPRAVLRSFGPTATTTVERIVGEVAKMPRELWPYVRAYWSVPSSFLTMARYFAGLEKSSAEMLVPAALPPIPLAVISAATPDARRREWQKELAALCPDAKHQVLDHCGHWVQLDRPDVVAQAIASIVAQCRSLSLS